MTILATRKKSGITSNSNCGAAKRAMRKRILAAKSALRRLSNTSSSSNVPTSSSDLSTSTIMAKGLFCNGEDELGKDLLFIRSDGHNREGAVGNWDWSKLNSEIAKKSMGIKKILEIEVF
ncbi:unnamed protein product [Meloidogyne enterolobii]|uniref:Uncharacterized protein n=1 Tax=Meloidogyne enterolobii TaxID=390850 RepID=A0ACB0YFY5_MELEN